MKKIYIILFFIIASIETTYAEKVYGSSLYYDINTSDHTAKVTYDKQDESNYANLKTIRIPSSISYKGASYKITGIDDQAFAYCSGLTSISIPNSIKHIGNRAFNKCTSIKSVTIPDGVITIGEQAFAYCVGLTSVTISNSVIGIGNSAFAVCSGIKSITIPSSVSTIGNGAFLGCANLTEIKVAQDNNHFCSIDGVLYNKHLTTIVEYPYGRKKETYTIPNSVLYIGNFAFSLCSGLTSIIIPNSVIGIGNWAFSSCSGLTNITIPNSVKSIGENAFDDCSGLKSIFIPNSVTVIGKNAFNGCSKNLIIYSASKAYIPNVPSERIIKCSQEEYLYFQPFSIFAKSYVENNINEWQQKGEFEKTADWQKRVNEQTRQQKIIQLLAEAEQKYIAYKNKTITINPTLGKYDADNEVFAMTDAQYGTIYMAVPINEAKRFKENWEKKKISHQLQVKDDQIKLASLTIKIPKGKKYTYRNTDAVNYSLAEIEYNFAPIELDFASSAPQGPKNITTTKIKAGKSTVDTNVPETSTSNPNTFVVIFANEDYKNVAKVSFAKNDGAIFQKYCQKTLGIPVTNIHYVENATLNDMRIQLAWLNDVCDAYNGKASMIVYYAGHGIPDEASKSAYLLPVDGDGRYVQSAYKLDDMYQKLGAMNAKSVTVFMDACFSGSKREEGMLASARGVAIKTKSGEPVGKMVVFSAASGDETAYPNNDEQHGMFTYYLLKKLQETKGDVTLLDLGNYITTNVRQQSIVKNGKSQTPCVTPSAAIGSDWQNWKLK